MKLTFHGAARTVTGSRHLLEAAGLRILVDCGLFQGLKELRLLNWKSPGFEPGFLDHLVLTHAHIDHTGYTPRLMQYGFKGPIHCTEPTAELLELMLLDAAHLQEEDAAWANKKGFSKHKPAEPLYTVVDALHALKLVRSQPFSRWLELSPAVRLKFHNSGHILGAAFVEFRIRDGGSAGVNPGETTLVFSGDLGRYGVPLHVDPEPLPDCDVLVVESTYGQRRHDQESVLEQIGAEFAGAVKSQGVVLMPSFAVGRTQMVGLILRRLMGQGDLAEIPIHIDSPMAVDATAIYARHLHDHNLDADVGEAAGGRRAHGRAQGRTHGPAQGSGQGGFFPGTVFLHRTVHESKVLNTLKGPRVIIAASGMMTGGRILHHLVRRLPERRNLILLTGFQALGTRGRLLQDGAATLRMHGQEVPVGARVASIQGLSSHADGQEIMRWIGTAGRKPRRVFVVHGEEEAATHLAERIAATTGAEVAVPRLKDSFDLGTG